MVGTHEIGCIAREMIAGIGLHRIHLQHILLRRSPEDIQLSPLVRIMVDDTAAFTGISTLVIIRRALHAALHVAQNAQLVLLAQHAHNALASAIGIAKESNSSAHIISILSVLSIFFIFSIVHPLSALSQADINHFFQTTATLHHFRVLANLDGFNFSCLKMMEQGSVIQTIFLVIDTDHEFSI